LSSVRIILIYAAAAFCLASAPAPSFAEGIESLKQYEFWNNGKIKLCTVYDPEGFLTVKAYCRNDGSVEKIERFDRGGNRIEEIFYDEKGRLKTGIDGWAAMRWWYEDSQLISQITYDENGRPIEKRAFSESGRLVFRQYRDDENLNPYVEASMAMLLGMGNRNVGYYDPGPRPPVEPDLAVKKKGPSDTPKENGSQ
jgi:hypothetical protein